MIYDQNAKYRGKQFEYFVIHMGGLDFKCVIQTIKTYKLVLLTAVGVSHLMVLASACLHKLTPVVVCCFLNEVPSTKHNH